MKRYAWLAGGLSLSMGLVACGGSDSDEVMDLDGGLNAEIKQLRDDVDALGPKFGELDTRLDVLEAPKVEGSCSVGELCIPDGVSLASLGLQPIISALCKRETTCCNAGELHYLYGNAVKSAADCEATFGDLINHGLVNATGVFGANVDTIVRAAHALNDTKVFVELVPAAVTACAADIAATVCPHDAKPSSGCVSSTNLEDPCSLAKLLKGKEKAGEACAPGAINECGDGLVCRPIGYSQGGGDGDGDDNSAGQSGICALKASEGDRCTQEADCDDLYCHFPSGTCKVYSKEGQSCAYIDPTFEDVDPRSDESVPDPLVINCEAGLSCDPVSKLCVKEYCAQGSWCYDNEDCGAGQICSGSGSPELAAYSERQPYGVCAPGIAEGATCVVRVDSPNTNDCVSAVCEDPEGDLTYVCQHAPVIGEACLFGGYYSSNCAKGAQCWDMDGPAVGVDYRCVQKVGGNPSGLADGVYCGNSYLSDSYCASGWCQYNGATYLCATSQAVGTPCDPTALGELCGLHMFCEVGATPDTGTCKKYLGTGEVCDSTLLNQCEPGSSCQFHNEEFVCSPYGGTCNAYSSYYSIPR